VRPALQKAGNAKLQAALRPLELKTLFTGVRPGIAISVRNSGYGGKNYHGRLWEG